jgi:hypothetical protein
VTPEMWLGMVFAVASIAVALMEGRRFSAENALTSRVAHLEAELAWTDDVASKLAARVEGIEAALRQDPHRRKR